MRPWAMGLEEGWELVQRGERIEVVGMKQKMRI